MQYAISQPQSVASLTLLAPVSPYGFGSTKGKEGESIAADAAVWAGAGTANPEFVRLVSDNDMSSESPLTPRNVMNAFYFKPPFKVAANVEDWLVAAMNKTVVGEGNYPGNSTVSQRPALHPATAECSIQSHQITSMSATLPKSTPSRLYCGCMATVIRSFPTPHFSIWHFLVRWVQSRAGRVSSLPATANGCADVGSAGALSGEWRQVS